MTTSPLKRNSPPDLSTTMKGNGNEDDAQEFQQIIRDRRCKLMFDLK